MKTEFLCDRMQSSFLTLPADDFTITTQKVCLYSLHQFVMKNLCLDSDTARDICDTIREFCEINNATYVDKNSNICITFSRKEV